MCSLIAAREEHLYKRVLVAYDGSREGRTALSEGLLLARRFDAEIYVLAVVADTPGMRVAEGAHAGVMAHHDEAYRAILDEAVEGLGELGVPLKSKLVRGEPAQEIGAYARQIKADVVVVGHRKQSLLQRWWSGPSGAYLTDFIGCSLLIARQTISREEVLAALRQSKPAQTTA
jgi:nucleotide-binding universal stress UspA family protein